MKWNLLGAIATNGMRIVVLAVLGRALDSHDFGVVAAAVSVNAFLFAIRDVGVGLALVQRKELTREHRETAFAVSVYLGVGISVLLVACAPLIGSLYHIEQAIDVIRVLGLLFAIRGLSATSRMICQRDMQFRAIALIETGAFIAGSVTSMALALAGMGPWALVLGYLVEEASATAVYLVVSPPSLSLRVSRARFGELMSFGAGQTVSQIAGVVAINGDNFVVGNTLGADALGYYARAYDLIKLPSLVFANVVGNVLFPAFSKLQDDPERLAIGYRRLTFVNALVLLPGSAALVVLAPETIRILMGPGWDSAVLPFQILAVTMLMRTGQKLGAIVATAANQVNAIAIAYLIFAAIVVGGAALSSRWGIAGVATTTAIAIVVSNIECAYLALRVSRMSVREFLAAHLPGLVIALAVGGITWPITRLLRDSGLSHVAIFVVILAASGVVLLAGIGLGVRRNRGDFAWLRSELGRLRRRGS